jgi:alpha-L-fucosidase
LIGNNHHIGIIDGEDFQMFEKDLPGNNTTGWGSSKEDISQLPLEVCETINNSWGFNLQDNSHKSNKELIQYLVKAAGYGANLLLNVGPMPNGKIQENHISSLKSIGKWLLKNGETIYETTKGPIPPTKEYVTTQKNNTTYLHIINLEKDILFIENIDKKIKKLSNYHTKEKILFKQNKNGLSIDLSTQNIDPIDTILKIEF